VSEISNTVPKTEPTAVCYDDVHELVFRETCSLYAHTPPRTERPANPQQQENADHAEGNHCRDQGVHSPCDRPGIHDAEQEETDRDFDQHARNENLHKIGPAESFDVLLLRWSEEIGVSS